MPRLKKLKLGAVQKDKDGNEWYIVGVFCQNGKYAYSRVRVGSLAHQIHSRRE
jgi:hypothetical protein